MGAAEQRTHKTSAYTRRRTLSLRSSVQGNQAGLAQKGSMGCLRVDYGLSRDRHRLFRGSCEAVTEAGTPYLQKAWRYVGIPSE